MTTVNLSKSDYTVLPEGETGLPPEVEKVFRSSKLRLENLIGEEIDMESPAGKERYNYAVFKAVILRVYETLDDPSMPLSVSNTVRRLLSEINATYEFRSPKDALSHVFQNGLTIIDALYECGYYDCTSIERKSSEGKGAEIDPKKNVESLEKLSDAFELPRLEEYARDVLRISGALNRSVEPDGSSSMDCRLAATRFWKLMFSEGGMDPNDRIGSFDETTTFLVAKYMVDPRNFAPLEWALKRFRSFYSEFNPNAAYIRTINPFVTDRNGVSAILAARTHSAKLGDYGFAKGELEQAYRRTMWILDELEGDWRLMSETFGDTPIARKLRETYVRH